MVEVNNIACLRQVPTDKGLVSHQVMLDVLVPEVFILGQKDLIVDQGTTLSLVCIIVNVRLSFYIFFCYCISFFSWRPKTKLLSLSSITRPKGDDVLNFRNYHHKQ